MLSLTSVLKLFSLFRKTKNMILELFYLAISLLIAIILYNNAEMFNSFTILGLKLVSLMLLVVSFFVVKYTWSILSFFLGGYRRLNSVIKYILLAIILVSVLYVFLNQGTVLAQVKNNLDIVDFTRFNPFIANVTNSTG